MRNSTMIWHTCTYNIRRAFSGVRLYVGLGVCAFACMFYLENALSLCQEYNVKASAVQLFINACTYSFTHSFLFIGWLIAICDTPYLSELQSNILGGLIGCSDNWRLCCSCPAYIGLLP